MDLPISGFAIFSFVLLALPGLVYSAVRRSLKGERFEDRNFGLTLSRVVLVSVLLDSAYFAIAGDQVLTGVDLADQNTVTVTSAEAVGKTVLVLGIVIPTLLGLLLHYRPKPVTREIKVFGRPVEASLLVQGNGQTAIPTAWDFARQHVEHSFVRIRRSDGTWTAGWFTYGSYMSTYPEPPSLFLGRQFEISHTGEIGEEIVGTRGVWVSIGPADTVEWVDGAKEE